MSHRDNGAPLRIPLSVRSGYLSVSDTGVWGVVGVVLSVLLVRGHR